MFSPASLSKKLTHFIGYRERVSAENIFVIEIYSSYGVVRTRPNWLLIVPIILVAVAAIIAVSILLYRLWRKKNCHPIYFAGKVRYARHGATINDACNLNGYGECWLNNRIRDLSTQGKIIGLYLDADLTIPLDRKQRVTSPIRIYPKYQT